MVGAHVLVGQFGNSNTGQMRVLARLHNLPGRSCTIVGLSRRSSSGADEPRPNCITP
jgi:hypothetical protein